MGEAMWRYEHLKGNITGTKPLITRETATTARNKYIYSNQKLIKTIGYKFLPVSQSIKEACKFYMKIIKA